MKKIDIYDNGAIGLCLWHTTEMRKRVLDPYNKGKEVGKKNGAIECIDKLIHSVDNEKDALAIKSPEEFIIFMKKHGFK